MLLGTRTNASIGSGNKYTDKPGVSQCWKVTQMKNNEVCGRRANRKVFPMSSRKIIWATKDLRWVGCLPHMCQPDFNPWHPVWSSNPSQEWFLSTEHRSKPWAPRVWPKNRENFTINYEYKISLNLLYKRIPDTLCRYSQCSRRYNKYRIWKWGERITLQKCNLANSTSDM